jgi:hypothetical protein
MAKASKAGIGEILSAAERDELKRFLRRGERDLRKEASLRAAEKGSADVVHHARRPSKVVAPMLAR